MAYSENLYLPPNFDEPFCAIPGHTSHCPSDARTFGTHWGAPVVKNDPQSCVSCGATIACLNDYTQHCPNTIADDVVDHHRSGVSVTDAYIDMIFARLLAAGRR